MQYACNYDGPMANVQVRNVPEDIHRKLKERAAHQRLSLSDYLLREMQAIVDRPSMEEWLEKLEKRSKVRLSTNPADIIREQRGDI